MAHKSSKECQKCGISKSVEDFHKDSSRKDGYHPYCKSCKNKLRRKHYKQNKEKTLEQNKKWARENPKKAQKWAKENPEYYRNYHRKWRKERYKNDLEFKLKCIGRSRIYSALQGKYKDETFIGLIGCTTKELIEHLESQFDEKMSWENHGEWHIDHIKPCDAFDLSNEEERFKCFHYSNLQPLWAQENLRKGAKKNK